MMNKSQAIAYGQQIGCRFYVRNSNGGLLGGFVRREDAEACKARWEKEYKTDPWNKGMTVFIEEV
jgi:hypothetical protein